jgi:hypothetical protein
LSLIHSSNDPFATDLSEKAFVFSFLQSFSCSKNIEIKGVGGNGNPLNILRKDSQQKRIFKNFKMCRRVALFRTDISEERVTPIIKVNRISELETTLGIATIEEWCLPGCYAVWLL